MEFEWDEAKNASNLAKHGVSFELAQRFLWSEALVELDGRRDYGELRYVARGPAGWSGLPCRFHHTGKQTAYHQHETIQQKGL